MKKTFQKKRIRINDLLRESEGEDLPYSTDLLIRAYRLKQSVLNSKSLSETEKRSLLHRMDLNKDLF